MKIPPTKFVENLKPYHGVSHKVWEYSYNKDIDVLDDVLKLDWNEATRFEGFIVKKILKYFLSHKIRLNWYPDVNNKILLKKISEYVKVPEENIQYFSGSDAALEYIARVFISEGDKVVMLSPTYDNFRVYVESCGAFVEYIFNKSPFDKDIANLICGIEKVKPKMVYIVNPNNPTGVLYSPEEIEILLKKFEKALFIIDEAYYEFCGVSCVSLVKEYENIVITRSFTKAFGLGAFRLGYIVAPKYIISLINKIRVGKNVNTFAQVAGIIALEHIEYMKKYVEEVTKSKELLVKELKKLKIEVVSTPANFILVKVSNPKRFVKLLEKNNIFVRDRSSYPQLDGYVRITVGDLETTKKFLEKIKKIYNESGNF